MAAVGEDCEVLPAEFYSRPVLEVARDLIGCVVEHEGCAGRIVETEAYHESEPACHAFVGVTARTRTLFEEPGTTYVYRSYGIHALLNAVCEPPGVGAAVLIRALEPLEGVETMRLRRSLGAHGLGGRGQGGRGLGGRGQGGRGLGGRGQGGHGLGGRGQGGHGQRSMHGRSLCSGPGKLTQALGIELTENGTSLIDGPVLIRPREPGQGRSQIAASERIGITKAVELKWRFCAVDSPHLSRPG